MGLDRFITLYLMRPVRGLGGRESARKLPVLMYHSISEDQEHGVADYYKVCTPPERFREHMRWLSDHGWNGVSLSDGLAWMGDGTGESAKPVAITFDDGFLDFFTEGAPILKEFGFAATMYLPTAFIGDERKSFKSRPCLTWSEVRDLDRDGMEFGSHTVNHPVLKDLDWPDIETELRDSKATMEEKLQKPVEAFAYPYAFPQERREFVERFRDLQQECGYRSSVTTVIGRVRQGDDPYAIKRLPANSADDATMLGAKLEGSYDWLATAQATAKRSKAAVHRMLGTPN